MWLWLFCAVFFVALALLLAFFSLLPERLLAVHRYLTGRDADQEMDAASYTFQRITRRLCAGPAIVSLIIGVCFVQSAVKAARQRPDDERRDQQRFEQIKKQGVGSLLSQQLQARGSSAPGQPGAPQPPGRPGK